MVQEQGRIAKVPAMLEVVGLMMTGHWGVSRLCCQLQTKTVHEARQLPKSRGERQGGCNRPISKMLLDCSTDALVVIELWFLLALD